MARKCELTEKMALRGNNVSHAHNKTRKTWEVNLKKKRIFDSETGKWVRVKVSTRALRTVNKKGIAALTR
ncbi:MAG: 50S ribosomal protein L28 [Proteobacteria bacterium]|nr:50S ribosomal protein L28 [Pseudomonadota bacterium]